MEFAPPPPACPSPTLCPLVALGRTWPIFHEQVASHLDGERNRQNLPHHTVASAVTGGSGPASVASKRPMRLRSAWTRAREDERESNRRRRWREDREERGREERGRP
ncbi:hypothetical protein NL676_008608 [Syzygium grande]|nr:hypothetical protein NL676_008608 [Syzygium grande]